MPIKTRTLPNSMGLANTYFTDHWSNGMSVQRSYSNQVVRDDVKSGFVTPGWRSILSLGGALNTAYERKGFTKVIPFRIEGRSYWFSPPIYKINGNGRSFGLHASNLMDPASIPHDAALSDVALVRLKRRLAEKNGQFQAAVPIVELRETRELIRSLAEQSTLALYRLAGLRKTGGRSFEQLFTQAWLTYSFAVRPTVAEIAQGLDAINDYLHRRDGLITVRGTASKDWTSQGGSTTNTALPQGGSLKSTTSHRHTLKYRYYAGFSVHALSANDYGIADHLRIVPSSLPSVGWELLPYSWMFDYFTNVGQYLDDTFVLPGGSSKFVGRTTRYIRESFQQPEYIRGANDTICTDSVMPGYAKYEWTVREVLTSLPRIGLHFKSVDQVGKNAVNKLLNLISVLKPVRSAHKL